MNKKKLYIEFINQYFEDEKKRNPGWGDDWTPENNLKDKLIKFNRIQDFLCILKEIIIEKNNLDYTQQMLWFVDKFLAVDFFSFETDVMFEIKDIEIKKKVIKDLQSNFTCDDASEFERLTLNERKEYLKKLDKVQGIPTKMKEFKKLIKERIEKFGNVKLPPINKN